MLDAVRALESKGFVELGHLLNSSHISLRDDYEVSCPELNTAVDSAISAGALGARMVGAGFGGSAIALIKESQSQEIIRKIEISFESNGFKPPRFLTSLPSQGAQIIQPAR